MSDNTQGKAILPAPRPSGEFPFRQSIIHRVNGQLVVSVNPDVSKPAKSDVVESLVSKKSGMNLG